MTTIVTPSLLAPKATQGAVSGAKQGLAKIVAQTAGKRARMRRDGATRRRMGQLFKACQPLAELIMSSIEHCSIRRNVDAISSMTLCVFLRNGFARTRIEQALVRQFVCRLRCKQCTMQHMVAIHRGRLQRLSLHDIGRGKRGHGLAHHIQE